MRHLQIWYLLLQTGSTYGAYQPKIWNPSEFIILTTLKNIFRKKRNNNACRQTEKKIEVIIEKKDELLWGIVENNGNFISSPYGKTKNEVIINLKNLIKDYQQNEGKKISFGARWR